MQMTQSNYGIYGVNRKILNMTYYQKDNSLSINVPHSLLLTSIENQMLHRLSALIFNMYVHLSIDSLWVLIVLHFLLSFPCMHIPQLHAMFLRD